MNYLDIVILIPLVWLGFLGFKKGLIIELATLLALVGGVFVAIKFSNFFTELLVDFADNEYLPIISFCITFIAAVVFVFMLGRLLEKAIKIVALGLVNRIAGALFGVLKGLTVILGLMLLTNKVNKHKEIISPKDQEQSLLYQPLLNTANKILPTLKGVDVFKTISEE